MSLNFSVSSVFFWEFCEIHKIHEFQVPQQLHGDWLCNWLLGSEKKCIVCTLVYILIIIIIIIIASISISFVVLLNCLYFDP